MSFTTNVKNEISQEISNQTANQAELSAILRNSYNRNRECVGGGMNGKHNSSKSR